MVHTYSERLCRHFCGGNLQQLQYSIKASPLQVKTDLFIQCKNHQALEERMRLLHGAHVQRALVPPFLRREPAAVREFNKGQPSPGKDRPIQAVKECVRLLHGARIQRALVPPFLQREPSAVTSFMPALSRQRQTDYLFGVKPVQYLPYIQVKTTPLPGIEKRNTSPAIRSQVFLHAHLQLQVRS
jgi:hypothetical protein